MKAGSRALDTGRDGRVGLGPRGLSLRTSAPPEASGLPPCPAAVRLRGRALWARCRSRSSRPALSGPVPSSRGPRRLGSAPWRVGATPCAFNSGGCAVGWGGGARGAGTPRRPRGQAADAAPAWTGAGSPEMARALRPGECVVDRGDGTAVCA